MLPEQAWLAYHTQVEEYVKLEQYGAPHTDKDNRSACQSWCQHAAFIKAWQIATAYYTAQVQHEGQNNEPTQKEDMT